MNTRLTYTHFLMVDSLSETTDQSGLRNTPATGSAASARRWAQPVWRWVGSARSLAMSFCALGALVLAALLLPSPLARSQGSGPLGASLATLLDRLIQASPATARLLRLGLGCLAALAILELMALIRPGWSPPPLSRLACWEVRLSDRMPQSSQRIQQAMAEAGQSLTWQAADGPTLYGTGYRRGGIRWLAAALPLGFLILSVALAIYATYGWSGAPQNLAVGEQRPLDPDQEITAFLDELAIIPNPDGSIRSVSGRLTVVEAGKPSVAVTLQSGKRTTVRDMALYGLGYGPAARVQAQTTEGQKLELRQLLGDPRRARVVRVAFVDEQQERWLAIPDRSLLIRMLYYAETPQGTEGGQAGASEPSIHVQIMQGRDGQMLEDLFLRQGEQIEVGGLLLDVAFEYYVTVQARRELQLPIAALGAALALIGCIGWIAWPPREAWVVLREDQDQGTWAQCCARRRQAHAAWFGHVRAWLSQEAEDPPEAPVPG